LAAGFLYGFLIGTIMVSIASNVAAFVAFLTSRHLARAYVEKRLGGKGSRLRLLDSALKKDGFRIVFLIRCSPLHPYGLCNYLFGLTSVSLFDFCVAGAIAMMPATIMEVYFGTAVKNVSDLVAGHVEDSVLSRIFFYSGLMLTLGVTVLVTVWVKRKLDLELYDNANASNGGNDDDHDDNSVGVVATINNTSSSGVGKANGTFEYMPVSSSDADDGHHTAPHSLSSLQLQPNPSASNSSAKIPNIANSTTLSSRETASTSANDSTSMPSAAPGPVLTATTRGRSLMHADSSVR